MFRDKDVLDIGCGAAGKTVFYATLGVRRIVGLEILERYRAEAEALAARRGVADRFVFLARDAADTGFSDGSFDTIIMNDAMEHVARPEAVLAECMRVLRPGGRLYVNFPPYHHPYGAHLSDAIAIPWVHLFFSEKTLIEAYKHLVSPLPDGAERVRFRIAQGDGGDYFSYINKMTLKRFKRILAEAPGRCVYYRETPLRPALAPLTKLPLLREGTVKMVAVVMEKSS
jgi:SAM-dependent methyltransferase